MLTCKVKICEASLICLTAVIDKQNLLLRSKEKNDKNQLSLFEVGKDGFLWTFTVFEYEKSESFLFYSHINTFTIDMILKQKEVKTS